MMTGWTRHCTTPRVALAMMKNGLARSETGEIDGFWREGTQFYHFYSVCPLLSVYAFWKMSEELSMPEEPADLEYRLIRMLMAPAEMCDEHLRLPVFGDLGAPRRTKLTLYRHVYEMGAGVLDDRQLHSVLAAINAGQPTRSSLAALAFGPDSIDAEPKAPESVLLPATGVAFVREGTFHAYLKAGPSLGGHDHCDKLSFGLSAHGQPIIADLGTAGYSVQEYVPMAATFGLSTVLINDRPTQKVTEPSLTHLAGGRSKRPYRKVTVSYLRVSSSSAAATCRGCLHGRHTTSVHLSCSSLRSGHGAVSR